MAPKTLLHCRWARWLASRTANGAFGRGWAPRKKTARPQPLEVPDVLRPILRDWWERHGQPSAGLIFPARRGKRAGEERKAGSVAKALRRDLARAFGLEAPKASDRVRSNNRPDPRPSWVEARPMTDRERELLTETQFTKPVDFHSFRRAFKQGLADANVDVQRSMALSGATDMQAHQRYLLNTAKVQRIPEAALPNFSIVRAETPEAENTNQQDLWCRSPDLNWGHRAYESEIVAEYAVTTAPEAQIALRDPEGSARLRRNSLPKSWSRRAADRALTAYLADMAADLANAC